ncbi:MAG TPA: type I glutamate--ammonia ligase [Thermoplasmata archaeon]|jgi:glutamine synthetase|nr:type I glutamate--ammonia ligase [Thermoplasmata archaeon]
MAKSVKNGGVVSVLETATKEKVRWYDLWFVDLLGSLQHITVPANTVSEDDFRDGIGKLDGSSIKGFKEIHESDMVLYPDPSTFAILPFYGPEDRTARFIVNVHEGGSHDRFSRDSRFIAQKAAKFAADAGYDTTYWGPEIEFFVFDGVRMLPSPDAVRNPWRGCGYEILSSEAPWSETGTTNFPIRFKEGYYPAPPQDSLQDYRNVFCRHLMDDFGMMLDAHHHEVATAGQVEIDMRYDEMVRMADKVVTYKYVAKMVAAKFGKIATFMPKPIYGDNASGMHVHQSLWTKGKNAMYDPKDAYAEVSQTCRYYVGGLLEHARAMCAITNPTTNSYRRLVPGYEAPVFIAWSKRNRSANVRIPVYYKGIEHAKRIEYRTPDPSCNPYLAFAAMLCAGMDGIKKKIDPGDPVDEDIYKLDVHKRKEYGIRELPGSLKEAVEYLNTDYMFLKGVFTQDLLDKYSELKIGENLETSLRPSPYEFYRYLDA